MRGMRNCKRGRVKERQKELKFREGKRGIEYGIRD